MRTCKKCGAEKSLEDFPKHPRYKEGRKWQCKECNAVEGEQYRRRKGMAPRKRANSQVPYRRSGAYKYVKVREGAQKRKIPVLFGRDDFAAWFDAAPKVCTYCGIEEADLKGWTRNHRHQTITVDRRDNDQPYDLSNLVLACFPCNQIKGSFLTEEEMRKVADLVLRPKVQAHLAKKALA